MATVSILMLIETGFKAICLMAKEKTLECLHFLMQMNIEQITRMSKSKAQGIFLYFNYDKYEREF